MWQLAQVNVAALRYPVEARELAEFRAGLDRINALADRSPGFVWRYPTGHLIGEELLDDPHTIVNLSVWHSYEHLHDFTYRTAHGHFLRRRSRWFLPMPPPTTALWWVPSGQPPTPASAIARLRLLRRQGPTAQAFTVRRRFSPDGRPHAGRHDAPRRGSVRDL